MALTRADIEQKLEALQADPLQTQDKVSFFDAVKSWLDTVSTDTIEKTQVLGDLESYAPFRNLAY